MPLRFKISLYLTLVSMVLGACGRSTAQAPAALPIDTPLPAATLTATPSTPLAILVVPADMDQESSDLYQKTVYDLAQQSGFRFQVRNTLTAADLTDASLKVVIVLPPDPGLASMALATPQVQFLAVNIPNLTAGGNLSVLAGDSQVEIPAFMAGYIGAMIADDYHIGMILPQGNAEAQRAFTAFNNGMAYYCGLCRPFYLTPFNYPQYIEIPADESPDRYGGYANALIVERKVYALYVYPDLASPDFLSYIGTQGAMIIGSAMPDAHPGGWVVTIQPDIIKAIQSAWPKLIAGQGGINVQSPLGLADIDPTLLTPGKERLAQQTLDDLLAGRIVPGNP
jgi:hypothetical protein